MKNAMLLCGLFATLATVAGAHAADTAELKVAGSVRPPSCTFNLASGGEIDYGNITPSRLSVTAATKLESRSTTFNIDCANGKAQLALKFSDNRASSIPTSINLNAMYTYGLGIVDGKKIGVYTVTMDNVKVDGRLPYLYLSSGNVQASSRVGWNNSYRSLYQPGVLYSWSQNSQVAGSTNELNWPGYFSTVSGELYVQVTIDKLSNLPVRDAIPLDGSATVELVYL
jgi:type 1 fimbria pilin